jgi:hypothetical protein
MRLFSVHVVVTLVLTGLLVPMVIEARQSAGGSEQVTPASHQH